MVRINVKKQVYEDFKIGPQWAKSKSGASKEPNGHKWSFFGKAAIAGFLNKKAFQKASYAPKSWDQKSIAKVSYSKNSYQRQWGAHGYYLARQGAQLENQPGLGFDANDDALNISKALTKWQKDGDPRFWKIILSPEMAHKLDLKEHVKAVMGHVEKDLGTKLEWVAIDHYNTDNPHAHIVMRGVDHEGKELRIKQEYFTQGFRQRSIQEATRALGLRLEQDAVLQRDKVIRAMHITEIDREIMRKLTKDNFINLTHPQSDFMYKRELQLKGRLMFLEEMGLTKKFTSASWHVDPDFMGYLRFIQNQQDIIKTKNRHIGNILNPNLPVAINRLENTGQVLIGRIVGTGLSERAGEPRYMLIEGIDNKIHYVLPSTSILKKRDGGDFRNGEIIYLQRRERIKEGKKIEYIYSESFKDFDSALKNEWLSNVDMFILGTIQESKRLPKADPLDGDVRKMFFDLMKQRVEVFQRENILRDDLSINDPKLNWSLENNVKITKGLGLRFRPDWGPTPQGD